MTETTTTRSVAEIEAELKAAKEAEARQKEVREQELKAARQREEIQLTDDYMAELAAELLKLGHQTILQGGEISKSYGGLRYASLSFPADSEGFKASAEPRLEYRHGSYSNPSSYQIQFGSYGERKTYPRLKQGGFNYTKIAAELAEYIQHKTAQREAEERRTETRKSSRQLVEILEKEFEHCTALVSSSSSDPNMVQVQIKDQFTLDQAREILKIVNEARTEQLQRIFASNTLK